MTTAGIQTTVLTQRLRQLEHWRLAAHRLGMLDMSASDAAWSSLEQYVGRVVKQSLIDSARSLEGKLAVLIEQMKANPGFALSAKGGQAVLNAKAEYLRVETTIDFFVDAVVSRSCPKLSALLRACDHIATRSIAEALAPLGHQVPAVVTYIDKGLGASILRAGIRLWDSSTSPVAAVKITRHNLLRPTSLIHEAGHQVAELLGWTAELSNRIRDGVAGLGASHSAIWQTWASEVAADAFAFVHTGYASAIALHDVIGGSDRNVFLYFPGDPHPIGWLRLLMVLAFCRRCFGAGPWDDLEAYWLTEHPISASPSDIRPFLQASKARLLEIANIVLFSTYRVFQDRSLASLIDPGRVSTQELSALSARLRNTALNSSYWLWNEALRLTALHGLEGAVSADGARLAGQAQLKLMDQLGRTL